MTAPRQILPGATILLSRRCFGRMLLLRPGKRANRLFRYILAVAAERYGIQLHAVCVMSNHFHLVLTDPRGTLPKFGQYLAGLVARTFNALLGRWESFWAPGSYSAVKLCTPEDVIEKCAYALANPVAAGLVRRGQEWPGVWCGAGVDGGRSRSVKRPAGFFRPEGPMPPQATLVLSCPPGFESLEEFRTLLLARVKSHEEEAAREMSAHGRTWAGVAAVEAQDPRTVPFTEEPRRGLNPRVASRDKWKRIEALTRLKEFLVAYREAWRAFARGMRDTVFPAGTYWMRVAHGVRCAPT